jgi:hypothetical protein
LTTPKATVAEHYQRYIRDRGTSKGVRPPGRPRKITQQMHNEICLFSQACSETGALCTLSAIAEHLTEEHDLTVTNTTIAALVKSSPYLKIIQVDPMEQERVDCPPAEIDRYFTKLAATITGMPASLICNFDEMGYGEYADAQPIFLILPIGQTRDELPVVRGSRRYSVLRGIFADGTHLKRLPITSRKTVDQCAFDAGFTEDRVQNRY